MTIQRDEFKDLEKSVHELVISNARLQEQVTSMKAIMTDLISRAEFAPVKLIAYGLATAVGSSVIMAILAKVIIK